MIVYQSNDRFYVPSANGVKEIPFSVVNRWREEGANVEIEVMEND
ncbi:hypothetical protein SAMN05877753_105377 [Bacillus oleivorans]|uniref:Uncharacterized protein n=1 Tax=Bacillus oleivorans TaxID=1448271 RepID=A0A285CXK1_9BACI|nr:hypothetical protein [Bacillus oleivorans]SNX71788.1 hypothetical protein SAMN05877753_105377 [Bacillus oleivorans]